MSENKEFNHCPSCGYELDTGWECLQCGADWEVAATGMNPSEAVYGFAGWLTTRDEATTMSAHHDSGAVVELVKEFCSVQGLPPVSHRWPDNLKPSLPPGYFQTGAARDLYGIGTPPSDDGYDSLRHILAMAVEQASGGKGVERHANGQPFAQQPICQGGRRFGPGCLIYQCWKKAHETPVLLGMVNGKERAVRELLGVINYAAAAILVIQEGK